MGNQSVLATKNLLFDHGSTRRAIKDRLTHVCVTLGGTMVFVALLMIFFYLLYVIKPIFDGANITPVISINEMGNTPALMVGSDEQNQVLYRVSKQGHAYFYSAKTGLLLSEKQVAIPKGVTVISSAISVASKQLFALGLSNGQVMLVGIDFNVSYPNNKKTITAQFSYPAGAAPITLDAQGSAITHLAFDFTDEKMSFVYQDEKGIWHLTREDGEENMMTEEVEWQSAQSIIPDTPVRVQQQIMLPDQKQLLLRSNNKLFVYKIDDIEAISLVQVLELDRNNTNVISVSLLAGASSLLVSYDNGLIQQYFQVNGAKGRQYQEIRDFNIQGTSDVIASEFYRKGFATVDKEGALTLLYTTSQRTLFAKNFKVDNVDLTDPTAIGFSPRANALIVESNKQLHLFSVDNAHPEVSWSAMWDKVWYEGYPEPKYVWQSTSGADDFEAKLSLTPLAFGTLKAALYAMLFATPLALAGAIYTAYFMSPKVRAIVKPTIEIMEALPTVILGFLAGLWLAPLVEDHLPGILTLFILMPLSILSTAFVWYELPLKWKQRLPDTYQELLLLPVICFVTWFSFAISPALEVVFFGGDSRLYITNVLGMTFNQRNALVVGIAMGFAVIPTIFSIAEDAIFSVPRHLSNGSLALGATTWQTLTRVVLLTASPGIFSAVMMGLGRAVGETMIVLMATGNTAIMEWSVFQGMRTLAANIAVEMPESAIGSSHYRVLFLAAFVLFIFTFVFNTIAEVVRQRLRERYSSL
ncbi:ABC transporter permease subunit [Shewanella surugensis]|uniref:ABC transporter permease subunit n=1 Tax=Shewanella surugensis TaxID=212020 RepID=A0ABT0L837_9GAMM|nr:ABC transporter permease subunit [Shewanella surugensis]MCL1123714.1 ABC transporter permease subunit [Shewanella surugensis]